LFQEGDCQEFTTITEKL